MISFSSSKAFFAEASQNLESFQLRIWETLSCNLISSFVGEPGSNVSCLAWDQSSKSLALGLSNGEIQIFSLSQKKIIKSLRKHSLAVNDLIFGKNGLFSCCENTVIEWDLNSGLAKREILVEFPVFKLKLNHSESKLAVGGSNIHIYSTKNFTVENSFTAHSTEIVDLVFSSNDRFCLSLAKEERSISVWDLQDATKKTCYNLLTLDSEIKSMDVSEADEVLGIDEFGVLCFWETPSKVKNTAVAKRKKSRQTFTLAAGTIKITDSESLEIPIHAASFSQQKVVIVRNSLIRPVFELIDYKDVNGVIQTQVLKRDSTKGLLMKEEHEIVGSKVMDTVSLQIQSGSNQIPSTPKVFGDLTIEEKLNLLAIEPEPAKPLRAITSVSSMHQLLSQAITSIDKELLDRCLRVRDRKMISSTVSRLEPSVILPLLKIVIGRCQHKPNDSLYLIEWIRSCLVIHSSYLLSLDQVSSELADLYTVLESRISNFESLLKLSGRLDSILIHGTIDSNLSQEPIMEFDETLDMNSVGSTSDFGEDAASDADSESVDGLEDGDLKDGDTEDENEMEE